MHAVVQQHMREVARAIGAERGEHAHAHERCAVAVHGDHVQVRTRERKAEREGREATHRAHHIELVGAVIERVELTAAKARGCQHHRLVHRRMGDHALQGLAARGQAIARGALHR